MSMANQLGVSIRSVAEGLGTLGRKGAEGAGGIVEGVGPTVKRLFGGR
jgi:pyridoxal biosynthesis lyase PdxS